MSVLEPQVANKALDQNSQAGGLERYDLGLHAGLTSWLAAHSSTRLCSAQVSRTAATAPLEPGDRQATCRPACNASAAAVVSSSASICIRLVHLRLHVLRRKAVLPRDGLNHCSLCRLACVYSSADTGITPSMQQSCTRAVWQLAPTHREGQCPGKTTAGDLKLVQHCNHCACSPQQLLVDAIAVSQGADQCRSGGHHAP